MCVVRCGLSVVAILFNELSERDLEKIQWQIGFS